MKIIADHSFENPIATATFSAAMELPAPQGKPSELHKKQLLVQEGGKNIAESIDGFDELAYLMQLLTKDVLSGVHLKGAFKAGDHFNCPNEMKDMSQNASWHSISTLVIYLISSFKLFNISYACENDGCLYVHLFPRSGSDDNSIKSRKNLRGHTDGSILPLTGENDYCNLPPGPDLVVLIGIENKNSVPTRIHPLSDIIRMLSPKSIRLLQESEFTFKPQPTFKLPGVTRKEQPVIVASEDEGYLIRYSHSRVTYPGNEPGYQDALDDLQKCIASTAQEVVVGSGDIIFVNNRTTIHGRGTVSPDDAISGRWLMRTYCQTNDEKRHKLSADRPNVLSEVI